MVTKRPTYPIGYSVAGETPIVRVLHTDASLELYSLSSGPHRQETLLLLRDKAEASLEWWRHLTAGAIKVEDILDLREIPGFTAGVRLSVLPRTSGHSRNTGRQIGDESHCTVVDRRRMRNSYKHSYSRFTSFHRAALGTCSV
jgi:hypothetical protein